MAKNVRVTVVSARNLRRADVIGLSDPYARCEIVGRPAEGFKTKHVRCTLNPTWNHRHTFMCVSPDADILFRIFDWDRGVKVDDFLGWVTLKNVNFWAYGFEGELPLQDAVKSNVCITVIVKVSEAASRAAGVPMHLAFHAPVGATLPRGTDCASLPVGIPIEGPLDTAGVKASWDIPTGFPVHVPDGNVEGQGVDPGSETEGVAGEPSAPQAQGPGDPFESASCAPVDCPSAGPASFAAELPYSTTTGTLYHGGDIVNDPLHGEPSGSLGLVRSGPTLSATPAETSDSCCAAAPTGRGEVAPQASVSRWGSDHTDEVADCGECPWGGGESPWGVSSTGAAAPAPAPGASSSPSAHTGVPTVLPAPVPPATASSPWVTDAAIPFGPALPTHTCAPPPEKQWGRHGRTSEKKHGGGMAANYGKQLINGAVGGLGAGMGFGAAHRIWGQIDQKT